MSAKIATTTKPAAAAAAPKTPKVEMVATAAPNAPKKERKSKEEEKKEEDADHTAIKIDFGSENEMEPASATAAAATNPASDGEGKGKKPGRPKGSKNKPKADADSEPATVKEKEKKPRANKKAAAAAAKGKDATDSSTEDSSTEEGAEAKKPRAKRATKAELLAEKLAAVEAFEAKQAAASAELRENLGLPAKETSASAAGATSTATAKAGKKERKPRAPPARKPVILADFMADYFLNEGIISLTLKDDDAMCPANGNFYAENGYYTIRATVVYNADDEEPEIRDHLTGETLDEAPVLGPHECIKAIKDGEVKYINADGSEIEEEKIVFGVTGSYFDHVPENAADVEKFNNFKRAFYQTGFLTKTEVFTLNNFIKSHMCQKYPDETLSTLMVEKKGSEKKVPSGRHFKIYGAAETQYFEQIRQTIVTAAASGDAKILEKIAKMRSREETRVPTKKAMEKAAEKGKPAPVAEELYVDGAFPEGDSFDYNENIPQTFIMQYMPFLIKSPDGAEESADEMEMEETA